VLGTETCFGLGQIRTNFLAPRLKTGSPVRLSVSAALTALPGHSAAALQRRGRTAFFSFFVCSVIFWLGADLHLTGLIE